ncbi:MAG TPA: DUF971 domain-containing protein [Chthoniobacterales bacterium]|nr:DUF971 domain-containing protein [Chthoniobacterales bacterium]
MRLTLRNVQMIGSELAIQWTGGAESYLRVETLRRACPCASCGGEPDVLGNVVRPHVSYTPASFELLGWQVVGAYALQPRWADGHNTGIYSYPYLRRLAGTNEADAKQG